MKTDLPENFEAIANDMGITLYQKFSMNEASLFLRCPEQEISSLIESGAINCIRVSKNNYQFFGYQLLEFLQARSSPTQSLKIQPTHPDRIIRAKEVESLTGLSRVTIWRYENKGQFPRRVSLGASSVGWKMSEVQKWISERS